MAFSDAVEPDCPRSRMDTSCRAYEERARVTGATGWLCLLARPAAATQEVRVDPRRRKSDRYRADGLGVEIRGTDAANDRVGVALSCHRPERQKEKGRADPLPSLALEHAGRPEERLRRGVVARETEHLLAALRSEARDRQAGEADLAFARPAVAELLAYPGHDDVPFGREGTTYFD